MRTLSFGILQKASKFSISAQPFKDKLTAAAILEIVLRQSPLTDWRYKRMVLWYPVSRDFKNTGTKKIKTKKPSAAKPVKRIINLFYSDTWHRNNS